jgi:hypothetical protein
MADKSNTPKVQYPTGQSNFTTRHQWGDFYWDTQRAIPSIHATGEEADKFKNRAFTQFKDQKMTFDEMAKDQDSFKAPDPIDGTPGREDNKNVKRMEYDFPPRFDGKAQADVLQVAYSNEPLTKESMLNIFKKNGFIVDNTEGAIGDSPIEKKKQIPEN